MNGVFFTRRGLSCAIQKRLARTIAGVYCSEDYIRETLSDGFNLVDFIPRGAAGNPHQDLVLLRRARH